MTQEIVLPVIYDLRQEVKQRLFSFQIPGKLVVEGG